MGNARSSKPPLHARDRPPFAPSARSGWEPVSPITSIPGPAWRPILEFRKNGSRFAWWPPAGLNRKRWVASTVRRRRQGGSIAGSAVGGRFLIPHPARRRLGRRGRTGRRIGFRKGRGGERQRQEEGGGEGSGRLGKAGFGRETGGQARVHGACHSGSANPNLSESPHPVVATGRQPAFAKKGSPFLLIMRSNLIKNPYSWNPDLGNSGDGGTSGPRAISQPESIHPIEPTNHDP